MKTGDFYEIVGTVLNDNKIQVKNIRKSPSFQLGTRYRAIQLSRMHAQLF